jgi:hypothetical protein
MRLDPAPSKDKDFYKEWSLRHRHCQACGIQWNRAPWPGLSTHHLIKQHRAHEACVLLRLCQRCHDAAEGHTVRVDGVVWPKLTIGVCLTLKLTREPEEVDFDRCKQLRGLNLPDFEPIPAIIEASYRKWRPRDKDRFYYPCMESSHDNRTDDRNGPGDQLQEPGSPEGADRTL